MTVCIAAACEGGRKCVTATDGLVSYGGITADVLAAKCVWKGDWEFMYAGLPANARLIFDEIDMIGLKESQKLTRVNIQQVTERAFVRFLSRVSSFPILSPFDLTIEEFKDKGLEMFGERFRDMTDEIERRAREITDQILVVGWGDAPASVMIYEISVLGGSANEQLGLAAIGSGGEVAMSNMLLLGQRRDSTLADTIYNVAAAKFAAEHSQGLFVGRNTSIHVSWRRRDAEDDPRLVGEFLEPEEIDKLRVVWEQHGRPRTPPQAVPIATRIANRTAGTISGREMIAHIAAAITLSTSHNSEDQLSPCVGESLEKES